LDGTNFISEKITLKIVLGFMDLDYPLRTDGPPVVTDISSVERQV